MLGKNPACVAGETTYFLLCLPSVGLQSKIAASHNEVVLIFSIFV